jgi:hypothetical protein
LDNDEENNDLKAKMSQLHKRGYGTSMDPKFNEEIITPYVIVNKTDMTFYVKRMFEKEQRDTETENEQRCRKLMAEEREFE